MEACDTKNVQDRVQEKSKHELHPYTALKGLSCHLCNCHVDVELRDYLMGKTDHLCGSFQDHCIYPTHVGQLIPFEKYPIQQWPKNNPQTIDMNDLHLWGTYQRFRRPFSVQGEQYKQRGTVVRKCKNTTMIFGHCNHTHPSIHGRFLHVWEGLEFQPGHNVAYITLDFNETNPLKLTVVNNYVKIPFPFYLAYLQCVYICVLLYNENDEPVEFSSLNTFVIGGFYHDVNFDFAHMPSCTLPFEVNGKKYVVCYKNNLMAWYPEDESPHKVNK